VAAALLRRGGGAEKAAGAEVPAPGLFGSLGRRGVPASLAEEWLDHFLHAGWLETRWLVGRGGNRLDLVILRNGEALREVARPGAESRRRDALAAARAQIATLTHPKAREIAALLAAEEADSLDPEVIPALAAVAVHVGSDETVAERVFSARWLKNSKTLAALRLRLERLVGPLAALGIREGAAVTLLGGRGVLRLPGRPLDLTDVAPFAGFARETLESVPEILFPAGGLLVVENLTAFEACCRGEVAGTEDTLIVWSAGYPGRAVRRLVEDAGSARLPVRVWADLDLDGVRIARLVVSWAPGIAVPWRMSAAHLAAAPASRPVSARAAAAIRRDLDEHPGALLADVLEVLLETGRQVEQETFLASSGKSTGATGAE
jgi:hypothetical protein